MKTTHEWTILIACTWYTTICWYQCVWCLQFQYIENNFSPLNSLFTKDFLDVLKRRFPIAKYLVCNGPLIRSTSIELPKTYLGITSGTLVRPAESNFVNRSQRFLQKHSSRYFTQYARHVLTVRQHICPMPIIHCVRQKTTAVNDDNFSNITYLINVVYIACKCLTFFPLIYVMCYQLQFERKYILKNIPNVYLRVKNIII